MKSCKKLTQSNFNKIKSLNNKQILKARKLVLILPSSYTTDISVFFFPAQKAIKRGCFLAPSSVNDTCEVGNDGFGYCYCHTDLCNHAATLSHLSGLIVVAVAVAAVLWTV